MYKQKIIAHNLKTAKEQIVDDLNDVMSPLQRRNNLVLTELPVLELSIAGMTFRIPQVTDTDFLEQLIRILRRTLCVSR
ncbi:hypothetical protein BRYFOR_09295 [Marvinbryantia formatexigens DSM 14469]|uniref:Uncharacterized protein n=1 Tax=Marvinbryantia formatexigens DSM 14469 TaxID=478749 RepID=C6LKU8_9FIRM|nr:hypothetical protein BRYFOR_09295 [Marvinbryantia formatexigens DSM 14469]